MSGETDLDRLIASIEPELQPGVFVFATLPRGEAVPEAVVPLMQFTEAEGSTLIVERDAARAAGIAGIYPCRMVTLNIHSSLEAVGFLARITTALAQAGISVNPVSAYYHDHLFVPEDRVDEVMALLRGMAR